MSRDKKKKKGNTVVLWCLAIYYVRKIGLILIVSLKEGKMEREKEKWLSWRRGEGKKEERLNRKKEGKRGD